MSLMNPANIGFGELMRVFTGCITGRVPRREWDQLERTSFLQDAEPHADKPNDCK